MPLTEKQELEILKQTKAKMHEAGQLAADDYKGQLNLALDAFNMILDVMLSREMKELARVQRSIRRRAARAAKKK